MSTTTLVHFVVFGAGAVLGAGIASQVNRNWRVPPSVPLPPASVVEKLPSTRDDLGPVLKYSSPGPIFDVLRRKAYVAAYDRKLRHPAWTAEHLTASSLPRGSDGPDGKPHADRGKSVFVEDEIIPVAFRARLTDYFRSGYDRGHMVPAADAKASQDAMDETFLLSNIAPQVGSGFNRHYWAYLEHWCRTLTSQYSDVFVFTIPLYLPQQSADGKWRVTYEVIGSPPNISVPTHFAKVVLTSKPASPSTPNIMDHSLGAFVLPNALIPDEAPLETFIMPVEAVERASGLTLFSQDLKTSARHICKTSSCQLVIRRFDDAQKQTRGRKMIASS
ncbi:hypothetical protein BS47DRAFT_1326577 [Hydnum rufescens UP504]|uniref:Endonuclease n=1 Tax=Hydnum rufescens UP504 TaxID=1448309 RepID=A0A9P6DXA5_9AGAM|nr:hypothetical protein BS47DRAFT_1326577 [Hydnum rufescens UP504]